MHCGSSAEITEIQGMEQGFVPVPRKMCHQTADAEGNNVHLFSAALLSAHFCPCLHRNSPSPFSYKLNCSFPLSVPPTKATLAVPQDVPSLLGFIPVPKGSHAEHQDLLSYFSSLPQALFQLFLPPLHLSALTWTGFLLLHCPLFLCKPPLTPFSLYPQMPPNASNLIYNCFFSFLLHPQLFHPAPSISAPQIQGRSSTAKLFSPRAPFPPHACKPHTLIDSWILTFSPLFPVKLINSHLCLCHVWVWPPPVCFTPRALSTFPLFPSGKQQTF